MESQVRVLILGLLSVLVAMLVIAHLVARRAIRELGQRLARLERQLGFAEFRTTWVLEIGLKVTLLASVVLMSATVWAFIYSLLLARRA